MSATEAASTFACPSSSGRGQRSGDAGSVPAARPSAYLSNRPVGSAPPAPATRNPASRKVLAKPSNPSESTPLRLAGPGRSYRAPSGERWRATAVSMASATASQCRRVHPVRGERSLSSAGITPAPPATRG